MKEVFIILLLPFMLMSCIITSEDVVIEDFSEPTVLSLDLKGESHARKAIQIKGEVDDSVYIQMCSICYRKYLNGKIDTVFRMDSGRRDSALFYFYPYKAKSGKLNITMSAF